MNLLIIGDVHLHYEKAERICRKFKDHKIIFVGDYFDQFDDSPEENEWCAEWLKESLNKPNRIHLIGNHDEQYDPRVNVFCSGYSVYKKDKINKVLTIKDWDALKYFHFERNWWISHAGICKNWFMSPIETTITQDSVKKVIDHAIILQRSNQPDNAIWAADYLRGGNNKYGSILWADWRTLQHIPNINQIVGHTPRHDIELKEDTKLNSIHINVDCSAITKLSQVLVIDEDGKPSIVNSSFI
jgi:hypothetical protein